MSAEGFSVNLNTSSAGSGCSYEPLNARSEEPKVKKNMFDGAAGSYMAADPRALKANSIFA